MTDYFTDDDSEQVQQWMATIRSGNESALAQLFHHFRPRLERLLQSRMNARLAARLDASDILQDTYFDACQQVSNLVKLMPDQAYVWLRGLAIERLLKAVRFHLVTQRRAANAEVRLPDRSSEQLAQGLFAVEQSPSHGIRVREMGQRVQSVLLKMKDEDREVILLRHFEGLSNQEVAQLLGISTSTATMRYGRALSRLKQELALLWPGGSSL